MLEESHREDLEELLFQLSEKKRIIDLTNQSNARYVGVFDGSKLVGFALLFILPKPTFRIAYLEDVVVHNGYRGRGLGKELMIEVIALAKGERAQVINLTSRSERIDAIALYESLGFVNPGNNVFRLTL